MNQHRSMRKICIILLCVVIWGGLIVGWNDEGIAGKPQIAFYAYGSEPILDWDPSVEFSNGIIVLNNVYETLLQYDPQADKMIPVLATEYSKSDNGLTWTFKIREGVKFHDGTALNAEAVKFSIERTIELGKGAAYIWDPVEKISLIDEYTVEFQLKYAAPLDLIASCGYGAFIISPQAVTSHPKEWLSQGNEAGTGPYMLRKYDMGKQVVLTTFKDYWKGWEGKHYDLVVFKKIAEASPRRQLVEQGEAQITSNLPYEDVEVLQKNPNIQIMVEPSFQNLILFFNTEKAPLDNKLLRQAISYIFPYQDVVKYAEGGYATQAKGSIPLGHWGHGENLSQYTYNLDKAKELLKEAGYPDGGLKFLVTYTSGNEAEKKTVELFKSELGKLGIELEIRGMPWESQWELSKSPKPEDRQDMFVMYWWPDYASPYSWLYNLYHTQEGIFFNLAYWQNAEFDSLIDEANQISGLDRRKGEDLFIQAQEILIEEAPSIFIYDRQDVWVAHTSFKGFKSNPAYPGVIFFYDTYPE